VYPGEPKARPFWAFTPTPVWPDIPAAIDLAVLTFRRGCAGCMIDQAIAKGVKRWWSFGRLQGNGPEGAALEIQVRGQSPRGGHSFDRPNCLGVINTDSPT